METIYKTDFLNLYHCDCLDLMKQYPDKYFELCIIDPPYGINADLNQLELANKKGFTKGAGTYKEYHKTNWDAETPDDAFFIELMRVSRNQIVWGGNYFHNLHLTGVIVWNKKGSGNFKEGELAKTSLNTFKVFDYSRADAYINDCDMKIHPTQKPVKLYDWILKNYAEPNQKILDTHFGSGSIALAVDRANRLDNMNLHLTACEIDLDYVNAAIKRISESIKQGTFSF